MVRYWLCREKQKELDAKNVAEKCLPKNCKHLRLSSREGKRCLVNGAAQKQLP